MNIAYISMDAGIPLFGNKGASNHLREFACSLARQGHRVTVFAARSGSSTAEFPCKIRVVPPPDLQVETDRALRSELMSLRRNDALAEILDEENRREPFDVFLERYSLWSCAGREFADQQAKPFVLEINSPLRLEQKQYRTLHLDSIARAIERLLFLSATLVTGVSREVIDYVVGQSGRTGPTLVLPNGVDLELFGPLKRKSVSGRLTVGFVGSLKPWHGIETLLEAFATLASESPEYHLLVVGDGPLREWLDSFVRRSSLASRVSVIGGVEKKRIPELLAQMQVAVAPYPEIADFYFSPLKLFEYMAAGCAIVASEIGQTGKILHHGKSALLTRPGSAADLAEKIRLLRADRRLRKAISRAARREAFRKHSWDNRVATVLNLLEMHQHFPTRPYSVTSETPMYEQ
jgi:glycosyltransferase involved in cell wall biosynthesis